MIAKLKVQDYSDGRWEQGDDEGAQLVFGIESRGAMVQDAGRVKTPVSVILIPPESTRPLLLTGIHHTERTSPMLPQHIPTSSPLILTC